MDKRTQAKIKAHNVSTSVFKLRAREMSSGYSLYFEVSRRNVPRKRGSLNLSIQGNAGSYYEDAEVIKIARKKLDDLKKKYQHDESLAFMDGHEKKKTVQEASFFILFEEYYSRKYEKRTSKKNFITTLAYLKKFSNGKDIKVKDITKTLSFNFKNYLDRLDLKNSSKNSYLQKYKEVASFLVENKHIKDNPIPKRFAFKSNIVDRQYLEEEELVMLMNTSYPEYSTTVCQAFIFGCFSGLRWADLKALRFNDIINGLLKIKQGKTDEFVEFELPRQAIEIADNRKKYRDDLVFARIGDNYRGNKKIKKWVEDAGINKTITWHVARHTFACLLLLNNVDIYHVSKLLGHTDIKSTMKYLHVLKEHKTKATEALASIGI